MTVVPVSHSGLVISPTKELFVFFYSDECNLSVPVYYINLTPQRSAPARLDHVSLSPWFDLFPCPYGCGKYFPTQPPWGYDQYTATVHFRHALSSHIDAAQRYLLYLPWGDTLNLSR